MKRTLFSFTLIFLSFLASASHIEGGQLFWTARGNNQYVLSLQLIRLSSGAGLGVTSSINSNVPSMASINLIRVRVDSLTPECYVNSRRYEIHTYESSVITIPAPAAGLPWTFSYSLCCMPNVTAMNIDSVSSRSFFLESVMYASGVNKSSPYIELRTVYHQKNSRNLLIPAISKNGRPVDLKLSPLLDENGVPYNYKPGFSATKPTSILDTLMPSGLFISGSSAPTGLAYLSFTAAEWTTSGSRMAKSNFTFGYSFRSPSPMVADPDVLISSNSNQFNVIDTSLITIKSGMGHNIVLQLDANVNAGSNSPNTPIIARLYTDAISHLNIPDPVLINTSGGGLRSNGSISTEFTYTVPYGFPTGKTRFVVTFEDGNCPINGLSTRIVEIENTGQYFFEYAMCEGDSVQFTTPVQGQTFSWYPTTGVSSPTDSITYIKPNRSTVYRLLVDGDTVARYSLNLNKTTRPSLRLNSFAQIELINASDYLENQLFWFYTKVKGEENKSVFTTANEGLYHLRAGAGSCMTYSDSMEILTTNTRYLCVYDTFIDLNTKSVLSNLNDTYLFKLAFGTGFGPTQIQKIIIPMVSASTSSSIIELEYINENSGQHFFTNGTLLPNGHLEFILPTSVVAFNRTYTFIIRAQSGSLSLTMGIHGGTPFKTRHAEVQTARYYNITTGARHDLLPQIIFAGTGDISITENHETIGIYPIPADDYVVVENVNPSSEYSLYSIDGRTIQSGTLEENGRFSTSHLAEGLYVLKVENEAGIFSQKVIINHR